MHRTRVHALLSRLHGLAGLIAPLCAASIAAASPVPDARPTLAAVRPRLVGSDNPALAGQVLRELTSGLTSGEVRLLAAADVDRVAGPACADEACLRRLRGELAADFVLRTTVTEVGRDFTLQLELIDDRDGAVIARSDETCELCGLSELRALTAQLVAPMLAQLAAAAVVPPRLLVVSDPPAALVHIDGRLAGVTPYERDVLPGEHTLRVTYDRHAPAERRFSARSGDTTRVALELQRSPATLRLRGGAWALVGAGLATLAGGAALLAIDGRCNGDVDLDGDCHYLRNTDWGGAGLLALGAGMATAGGVLLVRTRKRSGKGGVRLRAGALPTGFAIRGSF